MMDRYEYRMVRLPENTEVCTDWDKEPWRSVATLRIDKFLPDSSTHRPETALRLVHDGECIHGIFRVKDCYVRCVNIGYQASVCRDSCVELFISPNLELGYLNFEFNCGGSLLCQHIKDPTRIPGGFADFYPLSESELRTVKIQHSLPEIVEPEIISQTVWELGFSIPFAIFTKHFGNVDISSGARWRANCYKCADDSSHPHWAAWAQISEKNFHLPQCFGNIIIEPVSKLRVNRLPVRRTQTGAADGAAK